ncbi:hypothetical protein PH562_08205 [Rhizobium sp. CNPSo 4062]|uniref:hypothetical protein n=1 Tax=Rhizobium sp. CNPSo 4062 TaxID=3021410 RepID=UPI00254ABA49|nr:hypothetical protein [Rhizobium sp. CNPSo 4062]MDK4702224.1 hypothetical protein [Rhizobium sp. CNPSo 4062]
MQTFIMTGELVQGLADREFQQRGRDEISDTQNAGAELLLLQARMLLQSWQGNFAGPLTRSADWKALLECLRLKEPIRIRRPEGYAYYALYPESFLKAALRSGLASETVVIGVRSIGVGLGALVAAALGSGPAYSLRPTGDPFRRHVLPGETLQNRMLSRPDTDFAIVDEGPGLSGSSFGCIADWLEAHGVPAERLHFFPSHKGEPGGQVSKAHLRRWRQRRPHVVDVHELILDGPEQKHSLKSWACEFLGVNGGTWQDLSGGEWRRLRYEDPQNWPPSYRQQEKLKFLLSDGEARYLMKFAGLCDAATKQARGKLLSEAGFTPPVLGTCHGFIVEPWAEGYPIAADPVSTEMVEQIGQYLGFRAGHLPAAHGGASLSDLCQMAVVNIEEALGSEIADRIARLIGRPHRLTKYLRRTDTDNRLHRWEWVRRQDGRLMKTDALDHNASHDLIGCQDVAWDVAGACVEFDLSKAQRPHLAQIVATQTGRDVRKDVLDVFEACYLGFQIGLWSLAAQGPDLAERDRLTNAVARYEERVRALVANRPAIFDR